MNCICSPIVGWQCTPTRDNPQHENAGHPTLLFAGRLEGAKHGFPASFQYRSFDAKLDKDVSALDDGRAFNRNQTAIRHCVARVENEIQKRVLQTQAIALHSRQVGSDADLEMDFRLPYAPDESRDFGQTGTCARLFAEMLTDRLRLCFRFRHLGLHLSGRFLAVFVLKTLCRLASAFDWIKGEGHAYRGIRPAKARGMKSDAADVDRRLPDLQR